MTALAGCSGGNPVESFSGPTMGSRYTVQYVPTAHSPRPRQVQAEVERILGEVDQQLSLYRSDSDVQRFNAQPADSCRVMPPAVLALVQYGQSLSSASDGAYDQTVGPLMNLWGLGASHGLQQVPRPAVLALTRQRVGYRHLRIDGDQLCKDAAVEVDLNSVAAGYAVERIGARLQAMGIGSYLAEATGELKAVGHKPDGSAWNISVQAPRTDDQHASRELGVDGYGVSTSAEQRSFFLQAGQRYSHLLDARTGRPVNHSLASVTVIHPSALSADGLSTLLMILGPEQGWDYARGHDIAALFVRRDGEVLSSRPTPAFERMAAVGKVDH
ncbi:ApbE domain-containing protein [Pseudomonas sp. M47T1]|nr:ApbE domain-containing protein [Pseudomonas sp. M47T1]